MDDVPVQNIDYLQINKKISFGIHRVELLRSKFKRPTRKLSSMSTENGLGLKVDIEDPALGRQKMNNLKIQVIFCRPKSRSSILT